MRHNLAKQAFALRNVFPEVMANLKPSRLMWTGPLQPTSASRVYTVQIAYTIGRFPQVRVLRPELKARADESLPHVYGNGTLCLHLEHEWTSDMLIVDTIVPWTSEWLINYEIWRAAGEWYGGGQWPPPRTPEMDSVGAVSDDAQSPARADTAGG